MVLARSRAPTQITSSPVASDGRRQCRDRPTSSPWLISIISCWPWGVWRQTTPSPITRPREFRPVFSMTSLLWQAPRQTQHPRPLKVRGSKHYMMTLWSGLDIPSEADAFAEAKPSGWGVGLFNWLAICIRAAQLVSFLEFWYCPG